MSKRYSAYRGYVRIELVFQDVLLYEIANLVSQKQKLNDMMESSML
jgi:hypothetical protein